MIPVVVVVGGGGRTFKSMKNGGPSSNRNHSVEIVVVLLLVVVVVNNNYTWVLPKPMYGLAKLKKTPYFLFQKPMSGLNAHVLWPQEVKGGSLFILNL